MKAYRLLIILLSSILLGALTGHLWGTQALKLKPLGDIFLNMMFVLVVPLVFFSVSSAMTGVGQLQKIGSILMKMLFIFFITSALAAFYMLFIVRCFPPTQHTILPMTMVAALPHVSFANQLVSIITVSNFAQLFNRDHMLALIVFAALIGLATACSGDKGKPFANLLRSGMEVSMMAISFVMYYAPIGFFAYFAVLVAEMGPTLLKTYAHITLIYYLSAICYFVIAFTIFAFIAAKKIGIKLFWQHILFPAATSIATCSSAASIPANLHAAREMRVPTSIYELVIPLGGIIHKDGSVLGGIVKIAFLFSVFHISFAGLSTLLMAMLIAMLVGTVMGAIPSGGMVGEMLILSVYGFPPQSLVLIAAISILIDPPATLLNVTSNTACSMLVARLVEGKNWLSAADIRLII
ncbi:MAG: dicarboxylate/amino acid:cation symporter [Gammaproteobacteria bacterium]